MRLFIISAIIALVSFNDITIKAATVDNELPRYVRFLTDYTKTQSFHSLQIAATVAEGDRHLTAEQRLLGMLTVLSVAMQAIDPKDPKFDPSNRSNWPVADVAPPKGSRCFPGVSPDVVEPEFREEYKKALLENAAKSARMIKLNQFTGLCAEIAKDARSLMKESLPNLDEHAFIQLIQQIPVSESVRLDIKARILDGKGPSTKPIIRK